MVTFFESSVPLLLLALLGGQLQESNDFTVKLEARAASGRQIAETQRFALDAESKPRAVLTVKRGQMVDVKWTVTCTTQQATYQDLLVHCFVVKEAKAGQAAVPKLDKDVALESALTMDFNSKDRAKGKLAFKLESPGAYLLRVETMGALSSAGREFFAAMDVIIE